jgi:hypothetical protein
LLDLRDAVSRLKREAAIEKEANNELRRLNELNEKQLLEKEKLLLEKEKQLNKKDVALAALAARKTVGRLNFSTIYFVFVVGVLFGVSFSFLRIV